MKTLLNLTIDSEVVEACQPLIRQRQLSKVVNDFLRNLLLDGKVTEKNVIKLAEKARKPLKQKCDFAREELLKNYKMNNQWLRERSENVNQMQYWLNRCGFSDWDELLHWVHSWNGWEDREKKREK